MNFYDFSSKMLITANYVLKGKNKVYKIRLQKQNDRPKTPCFNGYSRKKRPQRIFLQNIRQSPF